MINRRNDRSRFRFGRVPLRERDRRSPCLRFDRPARGGRRHHTEFGELLTGLLRVLTQAAEILTIPGDEKKAIVVQGAASLFDAVADKCVSPWFWAFWVAIRPSVRSLVLAIAAGSIEQILPLVRSSHT